MRKYYVFFTIAILVISFAVVGKNKLASYLLTQENSSQQKVNDIISQKTNPDTTLSDAIFNNQIIDKSLIYPYLNEVSEANTNILGQSTDRWIEVNLSQQRLYAWEGSNLVYNYLISSGKWAPTPTGNFNIWIKLRSTRMTGGSKALGTYYNLPNVPCTMYFYKGYGLHGTYWHNNFGHPMSHGCVNMRTSEACTLYEWASVGTRVNIHY